MSQAQVLKNQNRIPYQSFTGTLIAYLQIALQNSRN